jgi:hypothetical protein
VDISAALIADLALLTQALDTEGLDLEAGLRSLAADVKMAVTSYTGMTVTIALDGHEVTFTVHDTPTAAASSRTSLLIPLNALTTTDPQSALVLYAATPGAFVDLAADLSYALGMEATALAFDRHLPAPDAQSASTGLGTRVAIDQAVGILIGRGHTPETARDELHRLADLDHGDLRVAAERVIHTAGSDQEDMP